MINKFEQNQYYILSELEPFNKIKLSQGDTLCLMFDPEEYDIDTINSIFIQIKEQFPNNKVIMLPNGIKLGVIRDDI